MGAYMAGGAKGAGGGGTIAASALPIHALSAGGIKQPEV